MVENVVVDDITGSRIMPEINIAAAHAGSNAMPAHRTVRNKIPKPTSIFDVSWFNYVVANIIGSRTL